MNEVSLNPFYRVQESKKFPHSRFFRRTFWEKIVDTFFIFAGQSSWHLIFDDATAKRMQDKGVQDYDKHTRKFHVGMVDYATFFLNPATFILADWCLEANNVFLNILCIPLMLLHGASCVINAILGAILTVLAAPIVGTAHLISKLAGGNQLKQQASKLKAYQMTGNSADNNLGSFLERTGYDYSDIIVQLYSKQKNPNGELLGPSPNKNYLSGQFRASNMYVKNEKAFSESLCLRVLNKAAIDQLDVPLKNMNQQDKLAIKALIQMNVGGLYDQIENCSMESQVEEIITIKTAPM